MDRKVYVISLVGCDDETVFEVDLTEEEANLVTKIADKANETSTYQCMPGMFIHEKEN